MKKYLIDDTSVDRFRKDGFLGPLPLIDKEEMDGLRSSIELLLAEDSSKSIFETKHNRHIDNATVYDLATHPGIVNRLASLYGPDLLLWRTNFFVKKPGSKEIPWHQDHNYWPLEPPIVASAWIAIDDSTLENGCVQVIPGSHRTTLPHIPASDKMEFKEMGDPKYIDETQLVNLEMEAGECILFNERTVHHSEANASTKRRIGLAVRMILPIVKVLKWDSPDHALIQATGDDVMGFNRHTKPPS